MLRWLEQRKIEVRCIDCEAELIRLTPNHKRCVKCAYEKTKERAIEHNRKWPEKNRERAREWYYKNCERRKKQIREYKQRKKISTGGGLQ